LEKKCDLDEFFSEISFYFAVRQNTGFAWMSWEKPENFNVGKNAD
jgi:hypothetical protein